MSKTSGHSFKVWGARFKGDVWGNWFGFSRASKAKGWPDRSMENSMVLGLFCHVVYTCTSRQNLPPFTQRKSPKCWMFWSGSRSRYALPPSPLTGLARVPPSLFTQTPLCPGGTSCSQPWRRCGQYHCPSPTSPLLVSVVTNGSLLLHSPIFGVDLSGYRASPTDSGPPGPASFASLFGSAAHPGNL